MDLDALKANPTSLTKHLKVQGIKGGNNAPANIDVHTGAGGTLQESINLIICPTASSKKQASLEDQAQSAQIMIGDGANCYFLPWNDGRAYKIQLQAECDVFFTPNLNGCAVFVSGGMASPTVVHANANIDRLGQAINIHDPAATAKRQKEVYAHFYGNLCAKLISAGTMPKEDPVMYMPDYYLKSASFAGVFGVRGQGGWKFYHNVNKKTRELWPKFHR